MAIWLDVARVAAALNVLLLAGLAYVWGKNALQFRTKHTFGLATFSILLLIENLLALHIFVFDPTLRLWLEKSVPLAQGAMMALRVVEFVALAVLSWAVWD